MKDVVIVSACRTAIGTFGGTLRNMIAADNAVVTIKGARERAGIDPAIVEDELNQLTVADVTLDELIVLVLFDLFEVFKITGISQQVKVDDEVLRILF